eukprot:TRINITY_DN81021_c0_g1_i1.p1 TRINITY_DN81021_c0_g1~~TRINITY_DN81021_c0_g1_i1.p1  ORF type:complete len:226 (+),score=43.88 TRINITY_DN81021_c0_g1_i1:156-833(+)
MAFSQSFPFHAFLRAILASSFLLTLSAATEGHCDLQGADNGSQCRAWQAAETIMPLASTETTATSWCLLIVASASIMLLIWFAPSLVHEIWEQFGTSDETDLALLREAWAQAETLQDQLKEPDIGGKERLQALAAQAQLLATSLAELADRTPSLATEVQALRAELTKCRLTAFSLLSAPPPSPTSQPPSPDAKRCFRSAPSSSASSSSCAFKEPEVPDKTQKKLQ